ncbi:hypothetical protein EJ06DRAFT_189068 [Trichodelitschia bisporula]|uniref:DNA excision repair protein n=1 Tax=Trichodelitschia bisporula TaxID=703511 RepID=A0A6G1I823_9PEZI|nr:hypothetical protein EJ06DRAFT_189068 [Trichodelitschia bisporula]
MTERDDEGMTASASCGTGNLPFDSETDVGNDDIKSTDKSSKYRKAQNSPQFDDGSTTESEQSVVVPEGALEKKAHIDSNDETTEDEDPGNRPRKRPRLSEEAEEKPTSDISNSPTGNRGSREVQKPNPTRPGQFRMRDEAPQGDEIEWSTSSDEGFSFRSQTRKTATKTKPKSEKPKASAPPKPRKRAGPGTGVGQRTLLKPRERVGQIVWDDPAQMWEKLEHVDTPEDEKLPMNVWNRRAKFEKLAEDKGMRLPPRYNDLEFSDDENLDQLQKKPRFTKQRPQAPYEDFKLPYSAGIIPAPIAQWLREYQVQGVEFLHELFVWQRGGILGDDMGLGKTIQVIAFLTAAFGKTGDERDAKRMRKIRRYGNGRWYPRVLIICPGGLMENWKAELETWGWWQVFVYHGSQANKEDALKAAGTGRLEIMMTTYGTYRRNTDTINAIDWDCVVADECHTIKGRKSEITIAMNKINALCRIGLTGTAIQNNYDELWTLLNWTNPGKFGSLSTWRSSISDPLRIGQSHEATKAQLGIARRTAQKLVQHLLPPYFLRRMKTLIAHQLPKKSDRVVFCPLTETQAEAYEKYVSGEVVEYIRHSADPCPCGSGKKRGWCCYNEIPERGSWQAHVFPAIVTLQKLANHIALVIPSSKDNRDKQDKDLDVLEVILPDQWRKLNKDRDSIVHFANQEFCGKWKILKKLLHFWDANGDKVLVFSHSVRLLQMLQVLFTTTTSYNVSYLDGSMSYQERHQAVNEFNFNNEQFVFLLSTRAGGVGLNITSANKVVVVDPNWNPSFDLQAQDRAYRIGQTRDVEVFRLVSAGTIEEIVYARQIYKQQQASIAYTASLERRYFRGVQNQKGMKGEIFGLENLFAYQSDHVVLRDIVNKTNVAESKAGVMVTDVEMTEYDVVKEDDDPFKGEKEEAAMSQLASVIAKGDPVHAAKLAARTTKKTDAVQAILASAGVEYTHENSEVIGSSKMEAKLSRRALQNADSDEDKDQPVFESGSQALLSMHVPASEGGGTMKFRFRPPEEVRMRQFCSMARDFGFEDTTEFAFVVEGMTQEERRNALDRFYAIRRQKLLSGRGPLEKT